MNRRTESLLTAILLATSMPAGAQWLNVPTKGIPRTKDGKPDLVAHTPRKPDGKPDSGGATSDNLICRSPSTIRRPTPSLGACRCLFKLLADTELMEEVCNENEKDLQHRVGK